MSQQWFYSKNGQQQGPVSPEQLKQLAAAGKLQPTDLVWKEGMSQWVAASSIKGLFTAPSIPTPPALPPPIPAQPANSLPKLPPAFYSWPAVLALLTCCFPLGHYLVWTHPTWTRHNKMIWSGVWLALIVPGILSTLAKQSANKARISEAHQLWASGDKANAISKYRAAIDSGIVFIAPDDRSVVVSRVVDYDAENGHADEARNILASSSKENVDVRPETTAGRALFAQIEEERHRAEKEQAKQTDKQSSSGVFGGWGKSAAYKEGYERGSSDAAELLRTRPLGEVPSEWLKSLKHLGDSESETGFSAAPYSRGSSQHDDWLRGYEDAVDAASHSAK